MSGGAVVIPTLSGNVAVLAVHRGRPLLMSPLATGPGMSERAPNNKRRHAGTAPPGCGMHTTPS